MKRRKALITGITGQDGAYLAELLLGKGYEVHGLKRRSSLFNTQRIDHLYKDPHDKDVRFFLHYGDLTDSTNLIRIVQEVQPDEVYNLGAQSHVQVSFETPEYTANADALGTLRLLEALRILGLTDRARFYQASTSELFGKAQEVPQNENTPFYPRSPYAVAKLYAYWITVNYREAYHLFACNGILFNHECVTAETPVFIRKNGFIDLLPIEDVVPHRTSAAHSHRYTTNLVPEKRFEVWDAGGWTEVTCMTATWNGAKRRPNKEVHRIASRGAVFQATRDHVTFVAQAEGPVEKATGEIQVGDSLALIDGPQPTDQIEMIEEEAWLLGILVAEGCVSEQGKVQVTNQDPALLERVAASWRKVAGGSSSSYVAPSGFEGGREVIQLRLTGNCVYGRYIRGSLYTRSRHKRIPRRVLNAGRPVRLAFLRGFNAGDGLQSTPCTYEFQGFKTASSVLAAGLYWMALTTLHQRAIVCTEEREGRLYYQINLNSPNVQGNRGRHLRLPLEEVVKAQPIEYKGWLFDLATTTGTFHAGIGQGWIHNSPIRGETFVTRKITRAAARIKLGLQERLYLGNLAAQRDWGHARDFVEGMWLMLQQDEPDDYVLATGQTRTVRSFCEKAFAAAGIDLVWRGEGSDEQGFDAATGNVLVAIDPRYFRPTEVDLLLGDAGKAREKLGWRLRYTFEEMIEEMTAADLQAAREEQILAASRPA